MARVTHFEIGSENPEKLENFYSEIFDWKFERWKGPEGAPEYWLIMTGGEGSKISGKEGQGIDGGMSRGKPVAPISMDVDNLDEKIERIREKGGKILLDKMAIPGVGWMIYFEDPDGNKLGLMQPDSEAK